jgi:hypothetical protein
MRQLGSPRILVHQDYAGAFFREQLGGSPADAGCGSRYDCDLVS